MAPKQNFTIPAIWLPSRLPCGLVSTIQKLADAQSRPQQSKKPPAIIASIQPNKALKPIPIPAPFRPLTCYSPSTLHPPPSISTSASNTCSPHVSAPPLLYPPSCHSLNLGLNPLNLRHHLPQPTSFLGTTALLPSPRQLHLANTTTFRFFSRGKRRSAEAATDAAAGTAGPTAPTGKGSAADLTKPPIKAADTPLDSSSSKDSSTSTSTSKSSGKGRGRGGGAAKEAASERAKQAAAGQPSGDEGFSSEDEEGSSDDEDEAACGVDGGAGRSSSGQLRPRGKSENVPHAYNNRKLLTLVHTYNGNVDGTLTLAAVVGKIVEQLGGDRKAARAAIDELSTELAVGELGEGPEGSKKWKWGQATKHQVDEIRQAYQDKRKALCDGDEALESLLDDLTGKWKRSTVKRILRQGGLLETGNLPGAIQKPHSDDHPVSSPVQADHAPTVARVKTAEKSSTARRSKRDADEASDEGVVRMDEEKEQRVEEKQEWQQLYMCPSDVFEIEELDKHKDNPEFAKFIEAQREYHRNEWWNAVGKWQMYSYYEDGDGSIKGKGRGRWGGKRGRGREGRKWRW